MKTGKQKREAGKQETPILETRRSETVSCYSNSCTQSISKEAHWVPCRRLEKAGTGKPKIGNGVSKSENQGWEVETGERRLWLVSRGSAF